MFSVLMALVAPADACSFVPPTVSSSWIQASDSFAVEVLSETRLPGKRVYRARVLRTFEGCSTEGDLLLLETSDNEASCGLSLGVGERWVVFAHEDGPQRLSFGMYDANKPLAELTREERDFLNSRPVSCDGDLTSCADGSAPAVCAVDACANPPRCAASPVCITNVCGGCAFEQYDLRANLVCQGW